MDNNTLQKLVKDPHFRSLPETEQYEAIFAMSADGPIPILDEYIEEEKVVTKVIDDSGKAQQCFINTEEINKTGKEMTELKTFVLGLNGKGGLQEDVKDMKEILTAVKASVDELSSRWIKEISETHGRIDKVDVRLNNNEKEIKELKSLVSDFVDKKNGEEVAGLKQQVRSSKDFWKGVGQNILTKTFEMIPWIIIFAGIGFFYMQSI